MVRIKTDIFLGENTVATIVGLAIALLGIIIQKTRACFLVAGWNASGTKEKRKWTYQRLQLP